jgi:hypothetical protein
MKQLVILFLFLTFCFSAIAQTKLPPVDRSPMDMCYFPNGFPLNKINEDQQEPVLSRVIYSRPQKSGRTVFGDLVEYGKVWRLGANEATEIEFFNNVKIGSTKVKKGRYTMYCIPYADKWTLIINKDLDTWGSFKYNASKDLVRITVPTVKLTETVESFTMVFEKTTTGMGLVIAWDNVKATLPITK